MSYAQLAESVDGLVETTQELVDVVLTQQAEKKVASFEALRKYRGKATVVQVTALKLGGVFAIDPSDTASADDNALVIIGFGAQRWKRQFSGPVSPYWFGATADGVADDTAAFVLASKCGLPVLADASGKWNIYVDTAPKAEAMRDLYSRLRADDTLVINHASGQFDYDKPMHWRVQSGVPVTLKGAPNVPVNITGFVSASGVPGSYSVIVNLATAASVNIGDWVLVATTQGTDDHYALRGVWEVLAVNLAANQVTLRITSWALAFPTLTVSGTTSVILKTKFKFNNCDGFVVPTEKLTLQDIMVIGNSDAYWSSANVVGTEKGTHGFVIGAQTIAMNGKQDHVNPLGQSGGHVSVNKYLGVSGFDQQGIVTENGGTFWGDFSASCNNKRRGYYASTGSAIRAKHISACGNYLDGVITDLSGACYSSSQSCASGNGGAGASATQSGYIDFNTGIMTGNRNAGLKAAEGGVAQALNSICMGNGSSGILAEYGSVIYCDASQSLNNAAYGIDANFGSQIRANQAVCSGNAQFGVRSTEMSYVGHTGAVLTGNVKGPVATRGVGLLLDGSTYRQGISYSSEYRTVNADTLCSARMSSTSGGDDLIIGYDMVGAGTYANKWHFRSGIVGFYSDSDNDTPLGRASNRFSVLYAGTGTINTSDARLKTEPRDLSKQERSLAIELSKGVKIYQWLDMVEEKGEDKARLHFGMTVQSVIALFKKYGLDAMDYGVVCYDKWDAEEPIQDDAGNLVSSGVTAGDRYGFRMDQLNQLIAAGISYRLEALEG